MKEIKEKKILAVEGKDEVNFFKALLNYMNIHGIDVYEVGGRYKFKEEISALVRRSGFSDVEILAIIRDADKDARGAFQSISNILKKEKLTPPKKEKEFSESKPKTGIFIMPGKREEGMLEDLCLKTVDNNPAMKCVEAYSECVLKLKNPPKNISKTKAQAYLAAMPKIAYNIGEGAQKGYWDFTSEELAELKEFIKKIGDT